MGNVVESLQHSAEFNIGALLSRHPDLQIERDDYNINVTANYGSLLDAEETLREYDAHDGAGKPAHLYYHFPLCEYICHFCNYVKQPVSKTAREAQLNRWTTALIRESAVRARSAPWIKEADIQSFYIGGGTAAVLTPRHLGEILDHVRETFTLSDDCEFNIEGNPDNFIDAERISALTALGFNRFSIGVQSFTEEVNRFTNRGHTPAMSHAAIDNLLATGAPFNVDMMFGLPYQTPQTVFDDIKALVDKKVPTITIYRLRNADRQSMGIGNTAAWNVPKVKDRLVSQGLFPSLESTYEMREQAVRLLMDYGYEPSPCGWWSLPNTYPSGNIPQVSKNKWQRFDTMLAFGPGAYGWLTGNGDRVLQTHNTSDIAKYLIESERGGALQLSFGRRLTGLQAIATALGFAFKSRQPIEVARFRAEYGVDIMNDEPFRDVFRSLLDGGLVTLSRDNAAFLPTYDGETLHEEIISVYLHGRIGDFNEVVCHKAA